LGWTLFTYLLQKGFSPILHLISNTTTCAVSELSHSTKKLLLRITITRKLALCKVSNILIDQTKSFGKFICKSKLMINLLSTHLCKMNYKILFKCFQNCQDSVRSDFDEEIFGHQRPACGRSEQQIRNK
jgi:hypothetical protein